MRKLLFSLLALAAAMPALAEVYKWTDADGRVHYGDRPPAVQAPEALPDVPVYASGWSPSGDASAPAHSQGPAALAACLSRSGAQFYGASWCSQCRKQLGYFGSAATSLPYVECSGNGTRGSSTRECDAAGIKGYPTWVFSSGARQSGVLSPKALAELSGCT